MKTPLLAAAVAVALVPCSARADQPRTDPAAPPDPVQLDRVIVTGTPPLLLPANQNARGDAQLRARRPATSDTAALLQGLPGVSLQGAGGASSMPMLHGMGGERNRLIVDGMDSIASCPNNMNPPLSSIDPTRVGSIRVYAGITPVSAGGDSIGGTVIVQPQAPWFAAPEQGWALQGQAGVFHRSNGNARGGHVNATLADDRTSLRYEGSVARAGNHVAGGDFRASTATGNLGHALPLDEVGSTAWQTRNHAVTASHRAGNHLWQASLSHQSIPYQLYPNQRMDMLDNTQNRLKLEYRGAHAWGDAQLRLWRETVDHTMEFGPDKQFWYGMQAMVPGDVANTLPCAPIGPLCAVGMPMLTESRTTGFSAQVDIRQHDASLWRVGAESLRYRLDDWWPASGGMMWPGTFWNIRDGRRDRASLFAEWERAWNPAWMSLLGMRYTRVDSHAGPVQGYDTDPTPPGSWGMTQADAAAFNASDRRRRDHAVDAAAMLRYDATDRLAVVLGYAHKVRMPSLYERYAWSTWTMAAVMNNVTGDGNGYVGNVALKPERAHTLSATVDWRAPGGAWHIKLTPYLTRVQDYVDAVSVGTHQPDAFNVLRHANQSARLHGLDASAEWTLTENDAGRFVLAAVASHVHGRNRDTGDPLYNQMPANARIGLTHHLGRWTSTLEAEGVQAKTRVSPVRNEVPTAGYGLLHWRASYQLPHLRLDAGVQNVFDRHHALPLGGVYLGQGRTMAVNGVPHGVPVPGPGRSLHVGVTVDF